MNRYTYKRNKNKGFTLAELLIVVAITIILAAVGFIAIFQYQQNLKFTEMENDAREVFLAAQNSLTSMKENGVELEDAEGSGAKEITVKPSDDEDSESTWKDGHQYRYVTYDPSDDKNSDSDEDKDPFSSKKALGQILDFGSVDETIRRDGSYIIEYDKETYTVYAVFYTDKGGKSDKKALSTYYPDDLNAIRDSEEKTEEEKRKKARREFGSDHGQGRLYCVGYYGPGKATKDNAGKKLNKPTIEIYNSGKITYISKPATGKKTSTPVNNEDAPANVSEKLNDTLALLIDSKDIDSTSVLKAEIKVSGKSSKITSKKVITENISELKHNKVDDWYYVTLDDITDSKRHFTQLFSDLIPGEDVSVSVHLINKQGRRSVGSSLTANSLFAGVDEEKDNKDKVISKTADVRSPRQLQNLEPNVSKVNELPDSFTDADDFVKVSKVNLTGDIDWNDLKGTDDEKVYQISKNGRATLVAEGKSKSFLSIHNSEIKSFDGDDKTISNLNITNNGDHAGLFSKTSNDVEIKNLTLQNPTSTTGEGDAGTLIGKVESGKVTISDITVNTSNNKNIVVSGKTYAGGLIGYFSPDAGSSISNARYEGGQRGLVKTVQNSAGGLIGRVESNGLTINNSYASTYVYTDGQRLGRAGGFIGNIETQTGTIKITNSFYGGRVKDQTDDSNKDDTGYDDEENKITSDDDKIIKGNYNVVNNGDPTDNGQQSAGGFVGTIRRENGTGDIQIDNCYTTGSVYVKAGYAGGFLGFSSEEKKENETVPFITLTNNYSTGIVSTSSENQIKPGSFIGKFQYITTDSQNNHDLRGMNSKLQIAGGNIDQVNTQPSDNIISSVSTGTDPFVSNDTSAEPYAAFLNGQNYPFKAVAKDKDNNYIHVGDWPKIPEPNITGIKADNGNKLTFHFALPEGTDQFTVAVTGQTSGKTYYVPMQIVGPDNDTKVQHVHWDSFTDVANGSDWFWINNQTPKIISDCKIARIESKKDYDAVNASDSISAALPSSVSSSAESSDNSIFIAMDLDDISSEEQNEKGPFAELFRDASGELIPGENITVRVLPKWEYNFDLDSVIGASANSIFANGSNGTDDGKNQNTALIANARHLENLENNISNLYRRQDLIHFNRAVQTDNIIWKSTPETKTVSKTKPFVDDMLARNNSQSVSIYGQNQRGTEYTTENHFYPILNTEITEYDGGRYSIENVNIDLSRTASISGQETAAIFDQLGSNGRIHNLTINNVNAIANESHAVNAAGLIGSGNGLTVENISITGNSNIEARGYGLAGGIVGDLNNTSAIENCKVEGNVQVSSKQREAGGAVGKLSSGILSINGTLIEGANLSISANGGLSAGGLIGSTGNDTTLNVNNSAASAYVIGENDAGGLVGQSNGTASITNSYAGGHTSQKRYLETIDGDGRYNVVAQTGYAGGLIGNNNGTLSYDKVFSATSVKSQKMSTDNAGAGGIFGHSATTNLNNGATSYVIGLVSGYSSENTGAYAGKVGNSFNVENAYYLPELYQKRTWNYSPFPKNISFTGEVNDANFDNDNTGVDAKDGDNFAEKTSVYDSTLNGSDYPFKVWTTFNLSDVNGRVYVGDWEPANMRTLNPETDSVNAVFEYQDPQTGNINKINGSYAKQAITVGKETKLTLPIAPSFSAAGTDGKSYEPDSWHIVTEDSQLSTDSSASGTASTIKVKQNVPTDLHIALTYKETTTKYKVTFTFTNPDDPNDVKTVNKLVNPGEKVVVPSKDFNGYKFDGWTDDNGNPVDSAVFNSVNGNISVHAKYHKIEKFTVTIQFMRQDDNVKEPLSQQPYVLTGIKGERLSRDVTLPSTINNLKPIADSAEVTSGSSSVTDATGKEESVVQGPTTETNKTRIRINADADTIINVYYSGEFKADGGYTIRHIFEDTSKDSNYEQGTLNYKSGETYTYEQTAQQDLGLATGANALDVTGFEAEPFTQKIVKDDNPANTVVEIRYKRRSHQVIYRSNGGTYIEPATLAYGQTITPSKSPTRKGYNFTGWTYTYRYTKDAAGNNAVIATDSTMPDEDVIATAGWTGAPADYRIMYWLENADDDGYSPDADNNNIIKKTGITGDKVVLTPDDVRSDRYVGFHYNPESDKNVERENQNQVIKGDNSTVVNVYYDRNIYTVNFYERYDGTRETGSVQEVYPTNPVNQLNTWDYFTISENVVIPEHNEISDNWFSSYSQGVRNGNNDFIRIGSNWSGYRYYYVGTGKGSYSIPRNSSTQKVAEQHFDSSRQYTRDNLALLYYLQYNPGTVQIKYYKAINSSKVWQVAGDPIPGLSIDEKYGADISNLWPGKRNDLTGDNAKYHTSRWNTVTYRDGDSNPSISQSGLNTMPLGGADFILPIDNQGNAIYQTVFHYEKLNGTDYDYETVNSFRADTNNDGTPRYQATPEDHYDVTGFYYDQTNQNNSGDDGTVRNASPKQISRVYNSNTRNYQYTYQWDFYYKRNEYNISFYNGSDLISSASKKVKYQAYISQMGNDAKLIAEQNPPGEGYTFGGWYTNAELEGEEYKFDGKKMPAGDLVFYAKWNPPVHNVTFDINAPSGLSGSYVPAQLTGVEDGKSIEDQMISQGNLSDAYTPKLQNADGSPNTEYNFTGWYTDADCKNPFIYASEIHEDTTLYAGWEHVAGQRSIKVNYKYRYTENGNTTETDLGQNVVTGDIGKPLTINAKMDIGGYYPQQTQGTVIVESEDANKDQTVTFYYNKVQFNWKYRVNYNVLYDNGQKSVLVESKEYDPKYYEMQIVYGSEDAPVPENLKGYRLAGNAVQTVDAEHAENGLVTVDFNLVPDTDLIRLKAGNHTYDGTGQKLELDDPDKEFSVTSSNKNTTITYSYSVQYGYRNSDGNYEYKNDAPVNAGIYTAIVTLNETVKDGASEEKYQIAVNDESDPVYLTVKRRQITLASESLERKYNGQILCSKSGNINGAIKMSGTWIVTDGNRISESSDASYGIKSVSFAANAFRLNPGEADNAFDYELSDNINELNYEIVKSYGKLTVTN